MDARTSMAPAHRDRGHPADSSSDPNDRLDFYVSIAEDAATLRLQPATNNAHAQSFCRGALKPALPSRSANRICHDRRKRCENNIQTQTRILALVNRCAKTNRRRSDGVIILFGAVRCVLLIANANVAESSLAPLRGGKEMRLRARCASRVRIIRQCTESVLWRRRPLGLLLAWGPSAGQTVRKISANTATPRRVSAVFTLLSPLVTGVISVVPRGKRARRSHARLNQAAERAAPAKAKARPNASSFEVASRVGFADSAGLLSKVARPGSPTRRAHRTTLTAIGLPEGRLSEERNSSRLRPLLRGSAIPASIIESICRFFKRDIWSFFDTLISVAGRTASGRAVR